MGLLNLPRIPRNASPEQMANIYNMAIEEMEHRINGFLQTNNVQEIGDWFVKKNLLVSKDGDVGMSTEDTGGDDVRFFAGGTDKDTAPWKVHQSGKMEATGAVIQSSAGYPKIVMDPSGNLFAAYTSADTYVGITPNYLGNGPGFIAQRGGNATGGSYSTSLTYHLAAVLDMIIEAGGDITFDNASGTTGVTFEAWNRIYSTAEGQTLKQALDALTASISTLTSTVASKATAGASTGSGGAVSLNGGISPGTVLMVSGGGTVTWGGINVPSHTHTQT